MPTEYPIGRIVAGDAAAIAEAAARMRDQPVDLERLHKGPYPYSLKHTTIGSTQSVSGHATFSPRNSTLTFSPAREDGWWIHRTDQKEQFPFKVSVRNVWTTARNIVLRCGSQHNYLRMVEHIIALRVGMGLDSLLVETDSGDPPLFDRGSLDLVETIEKAGIVEADGSANFITVKEPVTFGGTRGDFLTFLPARPGELGLRVDCAIDFASVIGQQRIRFDVTPENFRIGAEARTNAPSKEFWYTKTIGKLFADTRNLGYTTNNILIHGKTKYLNEPKLFFDGKTLEAVWHRATLDLLAAVALLDTGRFAGTIVSYRAGHTQDVRMAGLLYLNDLIVPHA
ncbi:MAG: UDP-3-O-acyl-N-acetylglucosamine deacetylase [Kiritimatiellia bacterium]|jgi:UDP-3-O-acyl-N-acetylglucosamine deacetylase